MTDEVVRLCSELIRIESTNTGDTARAPNGRPRSTWPAKLAEVGLEPTILESAPGRTSVIARFPAAGATDRDALLVHAHLDVVPADPDEWSVHPLSGEVRDGYVWGRGAVDMKDVDAMVLATVRQMRRRAARRRGTWCSRSSPTRRPAALRRAVAGREPPRTCSTGCTEAIGEVGGFSFTVARGPRLYLIETAEKGLTWLRLHAKGRPGHGSMIHDDNAVTALAEAVARVGRHRFPMVVTDDRARVPRARSRDALGIEVDLDDPERRWPSSGRIAPIIGSTLRNTANPTRLRPATRTT